jgi:DNA-binding transcriptional LysR family regulator
MCEAGTGCAPFAQRCVAANAALEHGTMNDMIDLDAMRVFAVLAEAKSFTTAAQRLGTTKATVSRALARLERSLGTELVHRTSRSISLSTEGLAFHERVAPHIAALAAATADRDDDAIGQIL